MDKTVFQCKRLGRRRGCGPVIVMLELGQYSQFKGAVFICVLVAELGTATTTIIVTIIVTMPQCQSAAEFTWREVC
jgi:hypothetical protein